MTDVMQQMALVQVRMRRLALLSGRPLVLAAALTGCVVDTAPAVDVTQDAGADGGGTAVPGGWTRVVNP